jgi:hypothetical protein
VTSMHFIGLDIHKKTISYCAKDVSGTVLCEGTVAATRAQLDDWMKTFPNPASCIPIPTHASAPLIQSKSRMRRRARTDLCGGRSAMVVPTATVT